MIERDYARVNLRPDAASVLRQLNFLVRALQQRASAQSVGLRSPREFRRLKVEKTTENAVGAVRRAHDGTTATEVVKSRPKPPEEVARSASLDASAAVDHTHDETGSLGIIRRKNASLLGSTTVR